MLTMDRTRRPADLLIRRLRIVDPGEGIDEYLDVSIRGGRIAGLGHHLACAAGQREIDAAERLTAMPAFVDPHVHVRVPGTAGVESIASGTAAAARGGYAAIVSMPNTSPVIDSADHLRALHARAAQEAIVEIGFAAAITLGQAGDQLAPMAALADAGALMFTDDGLPLVSAALLRRAMQYQAVSGRTIALHCEDPSLTGDGVMHEGAVSAWLGLHAIPAAGEWIDVARNVRLAIDTGAAVHIQHVSVGRSVEEVAWARSNGARVTTEVTPHHLLLTDSCVESLDPSAFKMHPPLRPEEDRVAVVEALRSGVIDCVATDHAPHSRTAKMEPFEVAPNGVIGLETAFASLYTALVEPGCIDLARLVTAMTTAPAGVLGIPGSRIAVGAPARLTIFDLDATWTVDPDLFASQSRNTPFAGRALKGACLMTLVDGLCAHDGLAQKAVRTAGPSIAGART